MARKVFISSDMSQDEKLIDVAETNQQAALIWPWLLTAFDDWGRAKASAKRLKASLFPMIDMVTVEDIDRALQDFARVGLIILYEVDGVRYMAIPEAKWYKYQTHMKRTNRRPGKDKMASEYPGPPGTPQEPPRGFAGDSGESRVPVPSPPPSPSPSKNSSGGGDTRAREGDPETTKVADEQANQEHKVRDDDISAVAEEFEACGYGAIHERVREELVDMLQTYGREWVIQALRVGMEQGRRTLAYVSGILQRWQARGGMTLGPPERDKKPRANQKGEEKRGAYRRSVETDADWQRIESNFFT